MLQAPGDLLSANMGHKDQVSQDYTRLQMLFFMLQYLLQLVFH